MPLDWHVERKTVQNNFWRDEERDVSAPYLPYRCVELTEDGSNEIDVDVIVEKEFHLSLNDVPIASFFATPREFRELATGFLLCEGFIDHAIDLISVEVEDDKLICHADICPDRIKKTRRDIDPDARFDFCSCAIGSRPCGKRMGGETDLKFDRKIFFKAVEHLKKDAKTWRRTGGTHSVIVCDSQGEILAFCEDVSRASAVDKAVGKAALAGVEMSNCALVATGRLSVTMVSKAINAGVSVLASKAGPINEGIDLARATGLTLVGFVRPPNMYVYNGIERII
ncbi:formate dehydrogenase accessory sulfurtransferase FdhD [Methanococcoides sp. FTZ1]|uniref:formate dehydrogenase accessory sulfurtransferase FdhD n=1 Tax=Methanococcoides sp. FTZ1 TaxID=3439061 RepID=UPI003F8301D6